jgi:hypothetical protein
LYALRRLTAAWPTKNRSRGLRPFVRFFSGTFCPPLELLRKSFIAAVKTSHTTGTLCAIGAKICRKYIKIKTLKNKLTKMKILWYYKNGGVLWKNMSRCCGE